MQAVASHVLGENEIYEEEPTEIYKVNNSVISGYDGLYVFIYSTVSLCKCHRCVYPSHITLFLLLSPHIKHVLHRNCSTVLKHK